MGTSNPTGFGALISMTVKAVLMAFVVTGVLPWDDSVTSTVALAVAAVADLAVILGVIKPRTVPATAATSPDHTDA